MEWRGVVMLLVVVEAMSVSAVSVSARDGDTVAVLLDAPAGANDDARKKALQEVQGLISGADESEHEDADEKPHKEEPDHDMPSIRKDQTHKSTIMAMAKRRISMLQDEEHDLNKERKATIQKIKSDLKPKLKAAKKSWFAKMKHLSSYRTKLSMMSAHVAEQLTAATQEADEERARNKALTVKVRNGLAFKEKVAKMEDELKAAKSAENMLAEKAIADKKTINTLELKKKELEAAQEPDEAEVPAEADKADEADEADATAEDSDDVTQL